MNNYKHDQDLCYFLWRLWNKIRLNYEKKPKPMVLVNKKPFLEHLLIQIKNLGIKKVFLLVGYKKKQIINYNICKI